MPKSMRKSMRKKHRTSSQNKALQQLFERFKKLSKRVKYSKHFKK